LEAKATVSGSRPLDTAQPYKTMKHIVLVGMMGAGKSSVGQLLSEKLARPFFDTDSMIEEDQHTTITEIFEAKGENAFRKMELDAVARVMAENPAVIATGGGTFVQELARNLIKSKSVSFYLECQAEVLLGRLTATTDRPLLSEGDMLETIREMLLMRGPLYLLADHVINTDQSDLEEVCSEVLVHQDEFA
jgi:shikimate kinase